MRLNGLPKFQVYQRYANQIIIDVAKVGRTHEYTSNRLDRVNEKSEFLGLSSSQKAVGSMRSASSNGSA